MPSLIDSARARITGRNQNLANFHGQLENILDPNFGRDVFGRILGRGVPTLDTFTSTAAAQGLSNLGGGAIASRQFDAATRQNVSDVGDLFSQFKLQSQGQALGGLQFLVGLDEERRRRRVDQRLSFVNQLLGIGGTLAGQALAPRLQPQGVFGQPTVFGSPPLTPPLTPPPSGTGFGR